ncbi:PAS domain-containing protein [Woodsholea maritima]|uniref:PAS domain-containing protein n=1 Tax=Woodsholea maritima TaxID=240237 RepID=UPI00037CA197|nr:PAS domain-containing protein [Woodsholea maritima]
MIEGQETQKGFREIADGFFANAPNPAAVFDTDMRYLAATKGWCDAYHVIIEEILGRTHYEVSPEVPERWKILHQRTLKGEDLSHDADPFLRSDGRITWIKWHNVPWYRQDKSIGGLIMYTDIITDQVIAQQALKQSADGIAQLDPSGRVAEVFQIFAEQFKLEKSDMVGTHWSDLFHPDDYNAISRHFEQAQTQDCIDFVARCVRRSGSIFHANITLYRVVDDDELLVGFYCHLKDVTQEVRANEELERKNAKLELAERFGHIGHWLIDLEHDEVQWSEQVYRIHGVSKASYKPNLRSMIEFYHPEDRARVHEEIQRAIRDKAGFAFEVRLMRLDGEMRYVHAKGQCQRDEQGHVRALFGIFQDITDYTKVRLALSETQERYILASESASVGLWDWNVRTNHFFWSSVFQAMVGLKNDRTHTDFVEFETRLHEEDREGVIRAISEHLDDRVPFDVTFRIRHDLGHYIWVRTRGQARWDEQGQPIRMAGSVDNMTREMADRNLRSEMLAVSSSVKINPREKINRVLKAAANYFGLEVGMVCEFENQNPWVRYAVSPDNSIHAGTRLEAYTEFEDVNDQTACDDLGALVKPAGRQRNIIGVPIYVHGKRYGVVSFSSQHERNQNFEENDFSAIRLISQWVGFELERQTALQALEESEARFSLAVQGMSVGVWDRPNYNQDAEIWSPVLYRLLGYEPDEIEATASRLNTLVHEHDRFKLAKSIRDHVENKGDPFSQVIRMRHKDHGYKWFLASGQAIWGEKGEPTRMIGSLMDIDASVRADQMKSEFVSTVSHELRTPMTSIMGALSLVRSGRFGELDEKAANLLAIAHSSGERLVRLINDLLDIEKIESGKLDFKPQRSCIKTIMEQAIEQTRPFADQFSSQIELCDYPKDVWVHVDPDRFAQVLTNLISNAVKFSPENSRVEVGAHLKDESIIVSVRDFGPGIAPEFRPKIFQKFSQADGSDQRSNKSGSGLGLCISKAIAQLHGGDLTFETKVGEGTTFLITLPILSADSACSEAQHVRA